MPIFALMFGMSMRFVSDSALRRGASPWKAVGRRMIALLAIGLLHSLVYPGEVLKEYAVAGLLMLPIALKAPRLLVATAALAVATVPALIAQTHEGGGPRFGYVGGIAGGVQAMLYICLMALACSCRIRKPLIAFFEPLGRTALTCYAGASLIVAPIGLALHWKDSRDVAPLLAVAALVLVVQSTAARLWLKRFRYGLLEWAWRCLTWWTLVDIRRPAVPHGRKPAAVMCSELRGEKPVKTQRRHGDYVRPGPASQPAGAPWPDA
ncbi:DUF418 domain-containing protein [Actinomyces israelii]|uniref:DUF418 domain-containing protein n=1 Tax=Actinomyces israelii TaxID=1659 RepID=A0ABT4I5M5_9ACTO|nr:DUF418 domain-containing protein [Actinomyces israelii]MCZ0857038.1 DUF418 domain-containing protein [Actinomyces israelii]